ncbi:Sulfoxide reductase heme-binding subunit YedZ [uncultured archaeon]|nr:Sulfoxide reductase heme-binding subunit YedZ [uncultured archaeon]
MALGVDCMQKGSFLFFLILAGVALIGAYSALFPLPSDVIMVRFLALSALFILSVSLMMGPLAVMNPKYASLIEPRRAVGLAGFIFAVLHILLAISLELGWQLGVVFGYAPILVAVPATLVLLAMALSSSDFAVQKLGANWKRLHQLIYIAFILILAHFVLQSNGLFAKTSAGTFVNLAEIGVLLVAFAAVLMQLYGFYLRRKRMASAAAPVQKQDEPAA